MTYSIDKFEAYLVENEKRGYKNGFFVGDEMTTADCRACDSIYFALVGYWRDAHKLMARCPKLAAWAKKMSAKFLGLSQWRPQK